LTASLRPVLDEKKYSESKEKSTRGASWYEYEKRCWRPVRVVLAKSEINGSQKNQGSTSENIGDAGDPGDPGEKKTKGWERNPGKSVGWVGESAPCSGGVAGLGSHEGKRKKRRRAVSIGNWKEYEENRGGYRVPGRFSSGV